MPCARDFTLMSIIAAPQFAGVPSKQQLMAFSCLRGALN